MIAQYRLYLELAAAVILCIGFALFVRHERSLGEQRQIARDQIAAQKQAEAVQAQEAQDRAELQIRSRTYEERIADLSKPSPVPVVRVCSPAHSRPVREAPAVASEPSKEAAPQLGGENGRDIGPELRQYALGCQAIAIQLDEVLKAWPSF